MKFEELDIKKNQHLEYSECYEVSFWAEVGDFWTITSKLYYGKTKEEHESVMNRWKSDYAKQKVNLVSVIYT